MQAVKHGTGVRRYTVILVAMLVAGGLALFLTTPAHAANVSVTSTADITSTCSVMGTLCLREAIVAAGSGGTVTFAPGVTGAITLNRGTMVVLNPITITGPGSGQLAVDGNNGVRVFSVPATGSSAISGLTITGGNQTDGGGLYVGGAMTLTDVTVRGNTASGAVPYGRGGGIFVDSGGTLIVDSSTIGGPNPGDGNTSVSQGGGIFLNYDSSLTMRNSVVRRNAATSYSNGSGGGIWCSGQGVTTTSTVTITGSTVAGNTVGNGGGGIASGCDTIVDSSTIGGPNPGDGNTAPAGGGGGIGVGGGISLTVRNGSVIRGNSASSEGGGIGTSALTTTITGSTVAGNTAGTAGGGIFALYQHPVIVDSSTIGGPNLADANTAPQGGGIYIYDIGPLTVRNGSVIRGNRATGGNGGGIYGKGPTMLTGSTVAGNSATGTGGGIFSSGPLTVVNATISGNRTVGGLGGSGIGTSGATTVVATTLTLNRTGSALLALGGDTHILRGSIVAGNAGGDGLGAFTDGGGNVLSGDPLLAPLGSYGGPTPALTHALLPGSPALDTQATCPTDPTTDMPLATDQRGLARPQAARCDSGAFESQGFTLTGNGNQTAPLTQAFPNPLAVTVVANDANAPVSGGMITFTLIPGSASATFGVAGGTGCTVGVNLLTATCPVGADGVATTPPLTAGAATGTLIATANAGTGTPITFTLTTYVAPGQVQPMANRAPNGPINDGPFTPSQTVTRMGRGAVLARR